MIGGGPFNLPPGKWTDDTSMALCLAESLLHQKGFDPADQMGRYLDWWQRGYLSSTGECFDIGGTVKNALQKYQQTQNPFAGSSAPDTAGNGSLMRLAPVVLFYHPEIDKVIDYAALSSKTTHAAPEAVESCTLFAAILCAALEGKGKAALLDQRTGDFRTPKVRELAGGHFAQKPKSEIKATGYCIASLEAALWCFQNTDSFESAILEAANLGDDADTTAAITGQLAGAYYGMAQIPGRWLEKLHMREEIQSLAVRLYNLPDKADRGMRDSGIS